MVYYGVRGVKGGFFSNFSKLFQLFFFPEETFAFFYSKPTPHTPFSFFTPFYSYFFSFPKNTNNIIFLLSYKIYTNIIYKIFSIKIINIFIFINF